VIDRTAVMNGRLIVFYGEQGKVIGLRNGHLFFKKGFRWILASVLILIYKTGNACVFGIRSFEYHIQHNLQTQGIDAPDGTSSH